MLDYTQTNLEEGKKMIAPVDVRTLDTLEKAQTAYDWAMLEVVHARCHCCLHDKRAASKKVENILQHAFNTFKTEEAALWVYLHTIKGSELERLSKEAVEMYRELGCCPE